MAVSSLSATPIPCKSRAGRKLFLHLRYSESRRPYRVELTQTCFGLDFASVIAFYDRSADERICGYGMDRVIVDRTLNESCGIAAVDELTDEQAEELKSRAEQQRGLARPRARR